MVVFEEMAGREMLSLSGTGYLVYLPQAVARMPQPEHPLGRPVHEGVWPDQWIQVEQESNRECDDRW